MSRCEITNECGALFVQHKKSIEPMCSVIIIIVIYPFFFFLLRIFLLADNTLTSEMRFSSIKERINKRWYVRKK
jgi:hypothetical protein